MNCREFRGAGILLTIAAVFIFVVAFGLCTTIVCGYMKYIHPHNLICTSFWCVLGFFAVKTGVGVYNKKRKHDANRCRVEMWFPVWATLSVIAEGIRAGKQWIGIFKEIFLGTGAFFMGVWYLLCIAGHGIVVGCHWIVAHLPIVGHAIWSFLTYGWVLPWWVWGFSIMWSLYLLGKAAEKAAKISALASKIGVKPATPVVPAMCNANDWYRYIADLICRSHDSSYIYDFLGHCSEELKTVDGIGDEFTYNAIFVQCRSQLIEAILRATLTLPSEMLAVPLQKFYTILMECDDQVRRVCKDYSIKKQSHMRVYHLLESFRVTLQSSFGDAVGDTLESQLQDILKIIGDYYVGIETIKIAVFSDKKLLDSVRHKIEHYPATSCR